MSKTIAFFKHLFTSKFHKSTMSKSNLYNLVSDEPVVKLDPSSPSIGCDLVFTGWPNFDKQLGGLRNGELVVITGFTNMGKTTFMHNLIKQICVEKDYRALFFSFQATETDNLRYLVSSLGQIPYQTLWDEAPCDGETEKAINTQLARIDKARLYICNEELDEDEICSTAEKYAGQYGIKAIFIDGFSNIKGGCSTIYMLDQIPRKLKALAMRLNVPIVITHTCQSTTPDLASSETSYPTLNPKKYSPIYDLADVLLVLHRPDAFGVRQDACGNDLHNTLVVGIEKNCHASQGVLRMKYDFSKKSVWEEE